MSTAEVDAAGEVCMPWDVQVHVNALIAAERIARDRDTAKAKLEETRERLEAERADGLTLRSLAEIVAERREPEWLLRHVLERGVLAVLAGPRGSFKSFVALDWAMRVAISGHSVLLLSGEGGGLDRRVDAWMRVHAPETSLSKVPVYGIERALALTSDAVMAELRGAMEAAGMWPALVVLDTLSKFSPGMDENDNTQVALFLSRLSVALRDRYGCTVLVVAHSGHGDAKRPRGASALMANPDAEYIIERPDPIGMLCTVSRERFKDTASRPALAYAARVVELGRADIAGDPVTSLVLEPTDAPPDKPRGKWGRHQLAAIMALREWSRVNQGQRFITTADMTALLKAQGIGAKRKHEVLTSLVQARVLTASINGYTFDPGAL